MYKRQLPEEYDPEDQVGAFKKSLEWGDKIPTGVIYRHAKPVFLDQVFEKLGRKEFLIPTNNYQVIFEDEKRLSLIHILMERRLLLPVLWNILKKQEYIREIVLV